ncbi:16S rRNA (uracil(1498)-N(3))-methyltransferase [bacterium]|nr:MAG: 16S rRNA (uracil(1498)-N(3))-methyltransferase [bacterium]
MSQHRFFVQNLNNKPILNKKEIEHARKVLRMNIGDNFIAFDGFGNVWTCEFENDFNLKVIQHQFIEKDRHISRLIISLFKFDRLEWAIEKCTELGIDEIIFTKTKFSQIDLNLAEKKLARWKEITISASKQCERIYIPELKVMKPEQVLKLNGRKFIGVTEFEVKKNFNSFPWKNSCEISLFIGPEGGFEKQELEEVISAGFEPVKISNSILRSETACMVGSFLISE